MVKLVEELSLGIFHPAYAPIEYIQQQLRDTLPDDCHILASQRLGISLTHWPDGHNHIVTDFATKEELIQVSGPVIQPGGSPWCWRDFHPGAFWGQRAGAAVGACRGVGRGAGAQRRARGVCLLQKRPWVCKRVGACRGLLFPEGACPA